MKSLKITTISAAMVSALSIVSLSSEAAICPSKEIKLDGCTFPDSNPVARIFRAEAKPYRSLWKDQCNAHDRNYQILGKSKQSSDSKFYEDMRRRCDSKFNKYLLPGANRTCKSTAYSIYTALKNVDSSNYYNPAQIKIQGYTSEYVEETDNGSGSCDMTPEYAGFYDPSLLSYINSKFSSLAGRKPTAYERFHLLNLYDVDAYDHLTTWKNRVSSEINSRMKFNSGPEVKIVSRNSPEQYKQDASSSVIAGSRDQYNWNLNIGSSYGPVFSKNYMTMYNQTHHIRGTLKVIDSNLNKDVKIINHTYTSQGLCAPNDNYHCF